MILLLHLGTTPCEKSDLMKPTDGSTAPTPAEVTATLEEIILSGKPLVDSVTSTEENIYVPLEPKTSTDQVLKL